jgi:hypothetical protein
MNILQIIQEATKRLKEPAISNAFSGTNEQAIAYLSAANKAARSILSKHNWANVIEDYEFNTVIGTQTYDLPVDFSSMETVYIYNLTNNNRVPVETSDNYLSSKAANTTSWTGTRFRLIRDAIKFTFIPDQVNTMSFSYISTYFAKIDGGTSYSDMFTTNTDTFLLDDELLIMGIVIIMKSGYGFDNSLDISEFNSRLLELMEEDKGSYIISDFSPENDPSNRAFRFPDGYSRYEGGSY